MGVIFFESSSKSIKKGQSAALKWKTEDCADCLIVPVRADSGVPPNGSLEVRPDVTTMYRFSCQLNGATHEKTVTIRVEEVEPAAEARQQARPAHRRPSESADDSSAEVSWKDDTSEFVSSRRELHRIVEFKDFAPDTMRNYPFLRAPEYGDSGHLLHALNVWITHEQIDVFRIETVIVPQLEDFDHSQDGADSRTKPDAWHQFFRVWYSPHKRMEISS